MNPAHLLPEALSEKGNYVTTASGYTFRECHFHPPRQCFHSRAFEIGEAEGDVTAYTV